MRRATTRAINTMNMSGSPAARLLGGCRSASIWRSDKPQDSLVSDLQDLNPQSTREKRFADDDTRPISSLSQDTASGVGPRMDKREGDSSYGKDDIRSTKEKMKNMDGTSFNKESGLDKDIKDERNRQGVSLEQDTPLYKEGAEYSDANIPK